MINARIKKEINQLGHMLSVNIPSHLNAIRIGFKKLRTMNEPKLRVIESGVKGLFVNLGRYY